MLKTTRAVQAILDLEDAAPDVLFEHAPGSPVPLWPQVRMAFVQALADHELGDVSISATADAWAVRRRLAKSYLPSRWDAARYRRRRDLCYLVGGGTTYPTPAGERNWLVGDHAELFRDNSVILQWRPLPSREGTPAFRATRSLDPVDARADFRAHRRPLPDSTASDIDYLVSRYAGLIAAELPEYQLEKIQRFARRTEQLRPLMADEFARILDHIQPEMILMEDASYGNRGALIAQFKRQGLLVVEPQHGWIGPSHGAYNFGAVMRQPEMLRTLPDELLTFGDFWSDGIRHPGNVTAIGKPHLERTVKSTPAYSERPDEVLVVSSIAEPRETEDFVLAVRGAFPESWVVRFRPHPSERASVKERYAKLFSTDRVSLDENQDVYESLATARVVIGSASTVLYEAAAFGCNVFARSSPFAEYYVGSVFGELIATPHSLNRIVEQAMASTSEALLGVPLTSLWKPDALEGFARWMTQRNS